MFHVEHIDLGLLEEKRPLSRLGFALRDNGPFEILLNVYADAFRMKCKLRAYMH